jgi:hypothetical protein
MISEPDINLIIPKEGMREVRGGQDLWVMLEALAMCSDSESIYPLSLQTAGSSGAARTPP